MHGDLDVDWARSVRDYTDEGRAELCDIGSRTQVEEALFADYSIDWALVAWALGEPPGAVRAALTDALAALLNVSALRDTAQGIPVVVVDEEGAEEHGPQTDDSLDSADRVRSAYFLAGILARRASAPAWPGGTPAEDAAVAAVEATDRDRFLVALDRILGDHDLPERDPRSLVSLPALGLSGHALSTRLVRPADLPVHERLPFGLLDGV